MNRAQRLNELMNMPDIIYSKAVGLKLLRYGQLYDRFDQSDEMHYNAAPEKNGTWGTVFPYEPFFNMPSVHDGKRHLDNRDQTPTTKVVYKDIHNNLMLQPITFFWRYDIYSHIDKLGNYSNKGWIHYHTTEELANVIRLNYSRLQKTVLDTKLISQNNNFPNSDIRYFKNHEFEVFVPHESLKKAK